MIFEKSESNPRLLAFAVRSPWPAALDINVLDNEKEYFFYKYALESFKESSQDLTFKIKPITQDLKDHSRYNLVKTLIDFSDINLNILKQDQTIGQCFEDNEEKNKFFSNLGKIRSELLSSQFDEIDTLLTNAIGNEELDRSAKIVIESLDNSDFAYDSFIDRMSSIEVEINEAKKIESLSLEYIEYILKNINIEDATDVAVFKDGTPENDFRHYLVNIARNDDLEFTDDPELFLGAIRGHAANKDVYDDTGDEYDYGLDDWDEAFKKFNRIISEHKLNPQNSPVQKQQEQQIEYAKLILESIKNRVVLDAYSIHSKMKKMFEELIQDTELTITSTAKDFVEMIENKFKDLEHDSLEYDKWQGYIQQLYRGYIDLEKPPSKRVLLGKTIRSSSEVGHTPISTSYQTLARMQPPPVGVELNIDVTYQQLKQKITETLQELRTADKINDFTNVQDSKLTTGEDCYQTVITDKQDKEIPMKITKNGQNAYVGNTYNKDNYKLLLDVFIKVNSITDPNKIAGINIPKDKIEEVQAMVIDSVNEYRVTKGLPIIQPQDNEIDNNFRFS